MDSYFLVMLLSKSTPLRIHVIKNGLIVSGEDADRLSVGGGWLVGG